MQKNTENRRQTHPGAFTVETTGSGTKQDLIFKLAPASGTQTPPPATQNTGHDGDEAILLKSLGMPPAGANAAYAETSIPEEQIKLKSEVERALIVIRNIYARKPDDFEIHFKRLYAIATTGTTGETAHPEVAWADLKMLKEDVVARSQVEIQRSTLLDILLFGTLFLLLGVVVFIMLPKLMPGTAPEIIPPAYFTLICSMFLGLWVTVAIWMEKLDFESLSAPLGCKSDIGTRVALLSILTIFLGILIQLGLIDVKIESFAASDFVKDLRIAAILGFICGMSHKALPGMVTNKTAGLFGALTKNTQPSK